MKRNPAIAIIMCLLVSFTFSACAPAAPSGQTPEFFQFHEKIQAFGRWGPNA